ncbi:uncharacterized protein TNCV_4899421 [Trichonephila clavipes]|nr:uncharacterized protein TNCV_4899421 [Trichonephila clavipes]
MLRFWHSMLFLRSDKDVMRSRLTMDLRYTTAKTGNYPGDQAVGCRERTELLWSSYKRRKMSDNGKKRRQKSHKTVDEKNSNITLQRNPLSETSTSFQPEASYIFTHKAVFSELLQKVPCKYCTNCTRVIKQQYSMGCSTKMELLCESCHESYGSVYSSFQDDAKQSHDINSKLVSAFLSIGRGHAALEAFFRLCSTYQQ